MISPSAFHLESHFGTRPSNSAYSVFEIRVVQVHKLGARNVFHLLSRYLADFGAVRFRRAFDNSRRALEQFRCGGRLGDEGEAAIAENRNQHGDDHSLGLFVRLGIELLAKLHDVDALRPSAVPTGGAGVALAAGNCSLTIA